MGSSNVFEDQQNGNNEGDQAIASEDEISLHLSSDDQMDEFIDDLDDNSGDENNDNISISSSGGEEHIEDEFETQDEFRDALRKASNFRTKKKKTASSKASSKAYWRRKMIKNASRDLDPEVRIYLSQANEAFVRNDFQSAINLYLEVIKKDPKNFSAYKTLGEIYKQQGKLNECCSMWLFAAEINPSDGQFWGNVAELSSYLGHTDQAIFCYGKAISSDEGHNAKYILERALLYKEKKSFGRALEGFQKVHQMFPTDLSIVKNLASVYVEQKRINDAINLYMRILDQNINPSQSTKAKVPNFGWAELNILCELYIQQHSWRVGIKVLKLVARWIQNRANEKWWDENDDDSEFDSRRFEILETVSSSLREEALNKSYELPIDIRYKIGCLRLGNSQKDEAMKHFEFLLEEKDDIADLFFEAGKGLEEHGFYEDALTFLTRASLNDEQNESTELITLLGKCFLELGDYQQAAQAYKSVLYDDPNNLDVKLALVEAVFHLGDIEYSSKLLQEVRSSHHAEKDSLEDDEPIEEQDDSALIKTKKIVKPSKKMTDEEKMEMEDNARRRVAEKYRRMARLEESINRKEKVAITAWMQLASQLVDMFINVRSFFPRDKNRIFKGIVLYRRKKQMGIDEKVARIYNLYEGISNDDNTSRLLVTSTTEYRGLSYDQWFVLFVQYAVLLFTHEKNHEYAVQIIEVAKNVSVFAQDKDKETMLKLVRLFVGISQCEVASTVMSNVRFFLSANQFSPFIYKFFISCFSSGVESWETFTNYNHQKFFLRQLKAYDSLISKKKITGMATIVADMNDVKLNKEHAELLYVYANLLGGSRSYVSSIVYLNRAYKAYNRDPMICLVLGLAHVHRSMQRLSNNRHIQLLQGISYILEYRDLRAVDATSYELQEIEYNLGRLFHMIGLYSPAAHHYHNALEKYQDANLDPNYDLSYEAAYNLSLIYNISGNSCLAREITEKFLTI